MTPTSHSSHRPSLDVTHSDYMALRRLVYILISHTLCWMPFYVIHLISAATDYLKDPYLILSWFLLLGYVHSMVNPFIYFMNDAAFKQELKHFFKKICDRKNRVIANKSKQERRMSMYQ